MDNEISGSGNQYDYGFRIYNPRLGRFLSVDPLTRSYPMLTPYQFASNRPVDGIDLDGLEWKKTETYDPNTGITNVHFQVKIKIENASKILSESQLKAIGEAAIKKFQDAYDIMDGKNKIHYSGSLQYEVVNGLLTDNDYGISITDDNEGGSKTKITGMTLEINTQKNFVSMDGTKAGEGGVLEPIKADKVARGIVHELTHTAGVWEHPFDDDNTAEDVDLSPVYFRFDAKRSQMEYSNIKRSGFIFDTYVPSPGANVNMIIENVMMYNNVKVNGQKIPEQDLRKVSPDQAKMVRDQVNKETNNGQK